MNNEEYKIIYIYKKHICFEYNFKYMFVIENFSADLN